MLSERKEK
uniref:Signal peptidase complex subunit 2 n=1 Tax=Triatoma infestans TaxID=30076 RepID=A0A161MA73_TRIIF